MNNNSDKKLIYAILAISSAMAVILLAIGFAEPVANSGGVAHSEIAGMRAGGDGAARLEHIGKYAFAFMSLLLLLIVCLSLLGVSRRHRTHELIGYMSVTFAFMMLVGWQMYFRHQEFLETGTTDYFMGFPIATAWQVYGIWLCGIPLIVIYSLGFRKFIFTQEDEQSFNELLENKTGTEE